MKRNIKIIVAVMCVLVVGASLVGCSCSSTDNKTNSTTSQSANGKNGTANSKDANNTNASANNGANANANNGANANANNGSADNAAAPAAAPESKGTGIVGTFRYVDAETPELTSSYTFNQDGTGQYELLGEKLDLTYKTNGNILSIMFAGQSIPMDVEYTVNAEALTMKDVTGNDVVYHRV